MDVNAFVESYKTKSEWGFNRDELMAVYLKVKESYPVSFKKDKFWSALNGVTGIVENGEMITYPCDVALACRCAIADRNPSLLEWD